MDDVRTVFRKFDQDGDGVITREELKGALHLLDPTWTDDIIDALLACMDASGDGLVQYEEFVDWLGGGGTRPGTAEDTELRQNFQGAIENLPSLPQQDSDDEDGDRDERRPGSAAVKPGAKKMAAKAKKRASGVIGVKCEKTLEFGKPVRSAICLDREVWTADWHGVVTVRDRDNAEKSLGTIPTERFVWSMLHIKPGLMLMGQEAMGISIFNSKRKEFKDILRGGHTGGVTCLACDDSVGDVDDDEFPVRKVWSGSNDFTLREWIIFTWRSKQNTPTEVSEDREAVIVDIGKWKVGFVQGRHMHGHKNGIKCLLKLGPILWSGSDDGSIRLWRCADSDCMEVVEDAHSGPVNKLVIVKSHVWSAGADGIVKEWTMTGERRQCTRQMAPPGSEKGIYALLPLGDEVWVCGHHPAIQVFSQRDMSQISEEDGHKPYVSNLLGIDRVESKYIWSTSFGDRKLKVWRHTTRGEETSVDELKAANILYKQEEETAAERINGYLKKLRSFEEGALKHQGEVEGLAQELAKKTRRCEELEEELAGFRKVFEEAGLGHLLSDFAALKAFTERGAKLEEVLRNLGLEHLLEDPGELGKLLQTMQQLKDILERSGFANILEDPSALEDILLRYSAMKKSFNENGFSELFHDVQKLDAFLRAHSEVRAEFQNAGFEQLLDDAQAAHDFFQERAEELARSLSNAEALAALEKESGDVLIHYNSVRKAFDDNGFPDLFKNTDKLDNFLRTHCQVRAAFSEAGLEELLDDAQAAKAFLEMHEQGAYDRQLIAKLRQVFEEAGQIKLLEQFETASTSAGGEDEQEFLDEENDEDEELEEDEGDQEDAAGEEVDKETGQEEDDEDDDDDDDNDDEDEDRIGDEDGDSKPGRTDVKLKTEEAEDTDAGIGAEDEAKESKPMKVDKSRLAQKKHMRLQTKLQRQGSSSPSFPALRAYLSRNSAFEQVLRDVGMEYLLDDPPELGRLLRLLKELRSILKMNGFSDVEKDPSQLAEVLSAYKALESAFTDHGFQELFEDPEYMLKAFLRNHNRIKDEFEKYGLGYLFDSVPAMRDFLAKWKDLEQELKAMKDANASGKLAARDAEMARLDARLTKKEEEIEALKARLKEYEQLGDADAMRKWKVDSEELKRSQRLYNSVSARVSELERSLEQKEREREEALARERFMSVKYKELDIFKLDVIARELKGLDNELARLGSAVKSLNQDAHKLKNYDEQQHILQLGDTMMDQCKLLRAHIRDVINKCLSDTQKMHIGVAIDDHMAAGDLKDGGTMVAAVYEEIERPDHGHSKAARLRQHDERQR